MAHRFVSVMMASIAGSGLAACATQPTDLGVYEASIDITAAGEGAEATDVRGVVFHDLNRDGTRQENEPGVADVLVSNGRDVVQTDADGAYALPVRDDMAVFVTKPAGWRTPVNADNVPQFAYQHKPAGSPPLRYGGLAPTGPLPAAINFPLVKIAETDQFSCAVVGDPQVYSNTELGYLRDSLVADLIKREDDLDCLLFLGDVAGDDLDLLPRLMEVVGRVGATQYYVHGNHDFDWDATSDQHSADSWRRLYGPAYYSFEIGDAFFIVLDNVVYPCGEEDKAAGREFCGDPERPTYNGRVDAVQMAWLENTLALAPHDKLIVLAHHIPFVSFVDAATEQHATDNVKDIHALVAGRPTVSLSGHTHTIEHHSAGDSYAGWREHWDLQELPFPHIIAGAASGSWWMGDFSIDGVPMSLQRLGAPRGYMIMDFDGSAYDAAYYATGLSRERQMWLSFSTPSFRDWYAELDAYRALPAEERPEVPPVNINDLPDVKLFTPDELEMGVHLTANVWFGSSDTAVEARINGGAPLALTRTQEARGEEPRIGVDYADPFAAMRQMQVARLAHVSSSGNPNAQGMQAWQATQFGPGAAQPAGPLADRSMHLWRLTLPADLPLGTHIATITATDVGGRTINETITFEVRAERPEPFWNQERWEQ